MENKNEVDAEALREQVKEKYRDVALDPGGEFHFHTGRNLTQKLSYDQALADVLPDAAVESFAGVANPFSLRDIKKGEKVVDAGSGGGFDCFIAQQLVGDTGRVIGVDMTPEMLDKSRALARDLQLANVEFREGLLEELPIEDEWADVVISGVINLCSDKKGVLSQIFRFLCPGGFLQFADIANAKPIPDAALDNIDLWTAWIAGGLLCAGWKNMLEEVGFEDVIIGLAIDTFGGASGEDNARRFAVSGHAFIARKPL